MCKYANESVSSRLDMQQKNKMSIENYNATPTYVYIYMYIRVNIYIYAWIASPAIKQLYHLHAEELPLLARPDQDNFDASKNYRQHN